jgi:hypothetical protein
VANSLPFRARSPDRIDEDVAMNLHDEFFALTPYLNKLNARYAVVGGIAMAFHGKPRFTRDVDILLHPDDFHLAQMAFDRLGYRETAEPWTFRSTDLTLHRFLRVRDGDEVMFDILLANTPRHQRMIDRAVEAPAKAGVVRVVSREDLVQLKLARNSSQDQVDIEALQNDSD